MNLMMSVPVFLSLNLIVYKYNSKRLDAGEVVRYYDGTFGQFILYFELSYLPPNLRTLRRKCYLELTACAE